jgi:hypothetical protein
MSRRSHPHSDIEDALKYAEENGWRIDVGGGHCWGKIYCPYNDKECRGGIFCISSVWSTPRNPGNHAKLSCRTSYGGTPAERAPQIRKVVDNCTTNKNLNNLSEEEE